MRIDVLNPWGRDAPVDYRNGSTPPEAPGHPPVNYWAFAAATRGRFHQTPDTVDGAADVLLLLLRWRGLANLRAIRALKARGQRVFVSWKESGESQIDAQLRWPWRRVLLRQVLALADGAIATTERGLAQYQDYGAKTTQFLPTPYPLDEPGWDFSIPESERQGIFVGSREFGVPSRRHVEALNLAGEIARRVQAPVTVANFNGEAERARIVQALGSVPAIRWLPRRLPYVEHLRTMAQHRIVVQRDAGWVPGQIAGDALLCGLVNIGGNGAVQRLAFPQFAEPGVSDAELCEQAVQLMTEPGRYADAVRAARERAHATGLSFASARLRCAQQLSP